MFSTRGYLLSRSWTTTGSSESRHSSNTLSKSFPKTPAIKLLIERIHLRKLSSLLSKVSGFPNPFVSMRIFFSLGSFFNCCAKSPTDFARTWIPAWPSLKTWFSAAKLACAALNSWFEVFNAFWVSLNC